jgi:hypothetical protein
LAYFKNASLKSPSEIVLSFAINSLMDERITDTTRMDGNHRVYREYCRSNKSAYKIRIKSGICPKNLIEQLVMPNFSKLPTCDIYHGGYEFYLIKIAEIQGKTHLLLNLDKSSHTMPVDMMIIMPNS